MTRTLPYSGEINKTYRILFGVDILYFFNSYYYYTRIFDFFTRKEGCSVLGVKVVHIALLQ